MPDETVTPETFPAPPDASGATADVTIAPATSPVEEQPAIPPPAAPPPTDEPAAAPEPTAASLRDARFTFLRAVMVHQTLDHALACTDTSDKTALSEHRELARVKLAAQYSSPEWVQLMLNLLGAVRTVQLPTAENPNWPTLGRAVFDVWRTYFAAVKPVDQELAEALHNLGNSIDTCNILGGLAQRAEQQGWAGQLDNAKFETVLDGHQSSELEKLGIKPLAVLPLVNAIGHARAMLAARAEHLKVSADTSAEKPVQEASA